MPAVLESKWRQYTQPFSSCTVGIQQLRRRERKGQNCVSRQEISYIIYRKEATAMCGGCSHPRSVLNYPINTIFFASLLLQHTDASCGSLLNYTHTILTPTKQKNTERRKKTKYEIRFRNGVSRKWNEEASKIEKKGETRSI